MEVDTLSGSSTSQEDFRSLNRQNIPISFHISRPYTRTWLNTSILTTIEIGIIEICSIVVDLTSAMEEI